MKILISTTTFANYNDRPLELLKNAGIAYDLNPHKRQLSEEEIAAALSEGSYNGLIAGTEPLTRGVLTKANSLKVISRVGTGIDNIDLKAAKELGVQIFNTPDAVTDAVAEMAVGLILNALRRISLADRNMRKGIWTKEMGLLFKGKKLGIIGLGRIGKRVAELSGAFGAEILFADVQAIKTTLARQVSAETLLSSSDILTIHTAGKDTIISKKEIDKMKNGTILVNTARGNAVDEEALYDALVSGKISYAAIDTFGKEPYTGRLTSLENVILTPHIGSYAREARNKMEIEAVENLLKGLGALQGKQ